MLNIKTCVVIAQKLCQNTLKAKFRIIFLKCSTISSKFFKIFEVLPMYNNAEMLSFCIKIKNRITVRYSTLGKKKKKTFMPSLIITRGNKQVFSSTTFQIANQILKYGKMPMVYVVM